MPPLTRTFPASELPEQVQLNALGKRRKHDPPAREVVLEACELLKMVQYSCEIQEPVTRASPVKCFPFGRLYRRSVNCLSRCWLLSHGMVYIYNTMLAYLGRVNVSVDKSGEGGKCRCRDKKGEFLVETTMWEKTKPSSDPAQSSRDESSRISGR